MLGSMRLMTSSCEHYQGHPDEESVAQASEKWVEHFLRCAHHLVLRPAKQVSVFRS